MKIQDQTPEMRIKPLPSEYSIYGDTLRLVRLGPSAAIYERKSPEGAIHWEVIKRRLREPTPNSPDLGKYDYIDFIPGTSEWGRYAWSLMVWHRALDKFRELEGIA